MRKNGEGPKGAPSPDTNEPLDPSLPKEVAEEEEALSAEGSDFGDTLTQAVVRADRTATSRKPLGAPRAGEWVGGADGRRYRLQAELGRGAMGFVYRAHDELLQRVVALKFLSLGTGKALASMLRQEARAIAQLDHANIVRLYELSEWKKPSWDTTVPFLVMECLEGEPLSALLKRGPLDPRRAVTITLGILAGLAHAHARHVIHRDLKPGNVFLTREGQVKLLDFGLARLHALPQGSAPAMPTAGTPGYMAPEQWRGEAQDARTDLWAAGVILHEMLTGEHPYGDPSVEELRVQVLSAWPVPSPRERRPDLPEALNALLSKALAKDAESRFQSATEFQEALRAQAAALGRPGSPPTVPHYRQVTLVSCRLAAPMAELDPDDVDELMAAFQQACSRLLESLPCAIPLHLGDEVLACFGCPVTREDDSEQAVRAGLALTALPQALRTRLPHLPPLPLAVQVGIHTAQVVLEEAPAERPGPPTILGVAPRVASWLAGQAAPGTVVLSEATHARVRGAFDMEALGTRLPDAVSFSQPLALYRPRRERKAPFRFERSHVAGSLTPLVGRERELRLLEEHWERARGGHGALVLLRGEAGIGKSRLLGELRERLRPQGPLRLRAQCWPQLTHSAFAPVMELLRHFLVEPEDPAPRKREKLEERLLGLGLLPEHVDLIALLLSLPLPEDSPVQLLAPERRKEKTFEALAALLLRLASERPVLLLVEDLHWADHSTLALLGFVLERLKSARLLGLLSARPEFQPSWPARPTFHVLEVERLSAEATALLVRGAAGGRELPASTLKQLVSRTDGIPLFAEELTHMVVERAPAHAPVARLSSSIPDTLHELLLARLDRLSPGQKTLAQLGAAVGRCFSVALLARLTGWDDATLQRELAELVATGLLQRQPEEGLEGPRYQFRHALIQDAAYQSLLRGTRRQHHHRIAEVLTRHWPEVAEQQPELLAHHHTEAGEPEPALRYWTQAGEDASRRSAYVEALGHLAPALKLLQALPDASAHMREELRLRIALGIPLVETQGYASPEVECTYERVRELAFQLGDELPQLHLSFWGPFSYYYARAKYPLARQLAERLVELGQRQHSLQLLSYGYRMGAVVQMMSGDITGACQQIEHALAYSDFALEERRALAVKHWLDPTASARATASVIHTLAGHDVRAREYAGEALRLAEELHHPHTQAFTLVYTLMAHKLRGEAEAVLERTPGAIAHCQEHRFRFWLGWMTQLRAWALAEVGRVREGLGLMETTLARWMGAGIWAGIPHFQSMLATLHLKCDRIDEGLAAASEGLRWAEQTGEHIIDAELYRLQGELLRQRGQEAEATRCFTQGLQWARQQGARGMALPVMTSLSRQLWEQGLPEAARRMLGEFLEGFAPESHFPWLQEARELLARLSEGPGDAPDAPHA